MENNCCTWEFVSVKHILAMFFQKRKKKKDNKTRNYIKYIYFSRKKKAKKKHAITYLGNFMVTFFKKRICEATQLSFVITPVSYLGNG